MNQAARLVVNIIGYPGCGKSTVCQHLAERGFVVRRPSDVLRAYASEHGIELHGRRDYIHVHHLLNQEDPIAIIRPIIASADPLVCLDGLRSPFLLDELQKQPFRTVTIALDCPIEERFARVQADDARRGTHRAPATLAAFRADELPDHHNPDRNVANTREMMARAEYTVDAARLPERVLADVDAIIGQLL